MKNDFLHGPIAKPLFTFAMPIAFTIIFEQLVNTTDVLILGQFVGKSAMAAVGNDGPVLSLLISLLVGLSLGVNVVIAQYLGGKKYEEARLAEHTGILFSFFLGVAFLILGEALTAPILQLLAVPPEVLNEAETYLRIFFLALPFVSAYNFEAAIFRASGDGKTPLYSLIAASIVNAVLDLVAVTIGLGLTGVVFATILAYVVDAGVLFFLLVRRKDYLHLQLQYLHLQKDELKTIVRIGLPAGIQGMVFSISNLVIQSAINSLGPEVMAASSAAFTVEINIYAFINAFGQATTTFVGQNFGAFQIRRCFAVAKKAVEVEVSFALLLGLVCCFLARPLMGLFTTDPEVIDQGIIRIYLVTGFQFVNGITEVLSGALRGYGYSLPPALTVLVSICGTRLIWIFTIFTAFPTFTIIMVSYPVSWMITSTLLAIVYRSQRKHIIRSYADRLHDELAAEGKVPR